MRRWFADFWVWLRASRRQRLEWRAVRAAETAAYLLNLAECCRHRQAGPEAEIMADLAQKKAERLTRKAARLTRLAFAEPDED